MLQKKKHLYANIRFMQLKVMRFNWAIFFMYEWFLFGFPESYLI